MTRISTRSYALPVPVRASERRGGGAAIVNPVAAISADRRTDGHDMRGRRKYDQAGNTGISNRSAAFITNGRMLAGMHTIGQQERANSRADAYEAVGRYEDRLFDPIEPGLVRRHYA